MIIAVLERGFQFLSRNPRLILCWCAEGAEELVFHPSIADCLAIPRTYSLPIQVCHHMIDIGRCLRAKIEMVGMLVHVEGEDRSSPWQAMSMVRGPIG